MSIAAMVMTRKAKLAPAETKDVTVETDLRIPTPDGVVLLADHYAPRGLGDRPAVLIRSVYTDRTKGGFLGRLIAERGFHVVIVSGRGTCGSGGTLSPFVSERDDGRAVLAWLREQPWFTGELGTLGQSYNGYTQWAIAAEAGSELRAMTTSLIGSNAYDLLYPGGALALELCLAWITMVANQEKPLPAYLSTVALGGKKRAKAARRLPLTEADTIVIGAPAPHWRDWLAHPDADDPWWSRGDHSPAVATVAAPNHLISGWDDIALPALVRDYQALRRAGREPYLTIGPWQHWDTELSLTALRESIAWLRAHLLGDRRGLREAPVRIYVRGAEEWRDLPAYPPAEAQPRRLHLHPNSGLASDLPTESAPDRYRFDPADPTPATAGMSRMIGIPRKTGEGVLAGRDDVVTYTGAPLPADLEVIGIPTAELHVTSSLAHTDFYVRISDVAPTGTITHVSDALRRFTADQPIDEMVEIELAPVAHRFKRGHRIRVQIASGAYPRWDRNLGTGEPPATGSAMRVADQQIHHSPARPSAVILPVT
ncbi:CocE/NonD family hydrolase [Microtetraspora malaysiensis]|uniref:CocE/NonD family hydrolase n=1 Tax=Microtetraspora malaysiensis TaxID=161358 RepID=UPI003D944E78